MERSPEEERNRKLIAYMRHSAAGLQLVISGGLGALGGWWLDGVTGLSPLFLILGIFLGFGAGIYSLYMSLFGRRR